MTILHIRLTGWINLLAGLCLFIGGTLHIGLHQSFGHWIMVLGDILLVFAITGLYALISRQAGLLGLVGYVLSILGLLLTGSADFITLADIYGVEAAHDVWMFLYINLPVFLYGSYALLIGILLFGLNIAYTHVLPRWAGLLMSLSAIVNLPAGLLPGMIVLYELSLALILVSLIWLGSNLLNNQFVVDLTTHSQWSEPT